MSVRIPGGRPSPATLRFLLAIVKDGGTSTDAQKAVGSWDPIRTATTRGWVRQEPNPGDYPGRVRYVILPAGRAVAFACDPGEYAAAIPNDQVQAQLDAVIHVRSTLGAGTVKNWNFDHFLSAVAAFERILPKYVGPIVGTDEYGYTTITTDKYEIKLTVGYPDGGLRQGHLPRIYFDDAVLDAANPELDAVNRQEENLGDLRRCPAVSEGGDHPEIDALYRRQNKLYADTAEQVAREVLPLLKAADVLGDFDQAIERVVFSRNAGCDTCPCSPGVVAGRELTVGNTYGQTVTALYVKSPSGAEPVTATALATDRAGT